MPIRAFQFTAVAAPRLTARLVRQAAALDATVVLDLEDALWDVTDEKRTDELKADGRSNLIALAVDDPDLFADQRVGVRVNRLRGPHAQADLQALAAVSKRARLACVVATKVESAADLSDWVAALDDADVAHDGVVPIVETRTGLANLSEVVGTARETGIEWIVYGHYDHSLDAGWWPIPELDSEQFWQVAQDFIDQVESAGLHYVQAPFFQLHQPERFLSILERLSSACSSVPGAITLGVAQTALAAAFEPGGQTHGRWSRGPENDASALALRVIDIYRANRRTGASFAVDARSGEFISPHLYLAARNYLKSTAD